MHGRIRGRLVKPWKFQLEKLISMCNYLRMERDSKKIVRRLLDEDFELISVVGSHHKFRKGAITVVVPHPKKDLPTGTARAIAKQAGWI
jgi:predicted RNA binding protein YcfA (HicA-like mRNA interferase family)